MTILELDRNQWALILGAYPPKRLTIHGCCDSLLEWQKHYRELPTLAGPLDMRPRDYIAAGEFMQMYTDKVRAMIREREVTDRVLEEV